MNQTKSKKIEPNKGSFLFRTRVTVNSVILVSEKNSPDGKSGKVLYVREIYIPYYEKEEDLEDQGHGDGFCGITGSNPALFLFARYLHRVL